MKGRISALRKQQMNRMQEAGARDLKVLQVYLNLLQESQELTSIWRHLLRASRFFQSLGRVLAMSGLSFPCRGWGVSSRILSLR